MAEHTHKKEVKDMKGQYVWLDGYGGKGIAKAGDFKGKKEPQEIQAKECNDPKAPLSEFLGLDWWE